MNEADKNTYQRTGKRNIFKKNIGKKITKRYKNKHTHKR